MVCRRVTVVKRIAILFNLLKIDSTRRCDIEARINPDGTPCTIEATKQHRKCAVKILVVESDVESSTPLT